MKSKLLKPNSGNFLKPINVYKVVFTLDAIAFSLIASADPPPVHFELGSAKADAIQVAQYKQNHKKKE